MPKYLFNKNNIKEVEKLLTQRQEIYEKYFNQGADVYKHLTTFYGNSIDARDFRNMAYFLAYKNPLMSNEEFEEEVKKFHDAVTPTFTKDELEFHRKTLIQLAKIEHEEDLKNVEKYKKEALEYEEYGKNYPGSTNKAKLKGLKDKSDPKNINQKFEECLNMLNKEDFSEADFYNVVRIYAVGKDYLNEVSKTNFKKLFNKGYKYIEELDNFRSEMLLNIDSMDSNKIEDSYKMVVFGLLSQTYRVKGQEFKGAIDREIKTLDKFKFKEENDNRAHQIIDDINSDCHELGFDPKAFSSLTVSSDGSYSDKSLEYIEIQTKSRKIVNSMLDGRVEFELLKSDYELVKKAKKYLKNLNNPNLAKAFTTKSNDSFKLLAKSLSRVTETDTSARPRAGVEFYQTIFVDGKPLHEIEPLKSYIQNMDERDDRTVYKAPIAEAILLKSMLEGGHHITCARFTEFRNKLYTDIVPIHVNVNQNDYMQSKGRWYRFWHGKRDIQAHLDEKMQKISKSKIEEYNKITKSYLDSYTKEYYSNTIVIQSKSNDISLGNLLGLDKKELDVNLDLNLDLNNNLKEPELNLNELDKKLDNNLIK